MTMPDIPEPTSYGLTKNISIDYVKIVKKISKILNMKIKLKILLNTTMSQTSILKEPF